MQTNEPECPQVTIIKLRERIKELEDELFDIESEGLRDGSED
jgi:hypothetical protein